MKKIILLYLLMLNASAMSATNSQSGDFPDQKVLEAQSLYSSEYYAIKDNRLKIEEQCFSGLNGKRLVYLNNTTTVFPPPSSNSDFGISYQVHTSGLCII